MRRKSGVGSKLWWHFRWRLGFSDAKAAVLDAEGLDMKLMYRVCEREV